MFNDIVPRKPTPAAAPRRTFTPAVDVRETQDALVLWADMPGVAEKDLEVTLEGNALTISGRPSSHGPSDRAPRWRESAEGDWRRRFVLSLDALNAEGIRAVLKDGVLRVTLPKADQAKRKSIPVTAA